MYSTGNFGREEVVGKQDVDRAISLLDRFSCVVGSRKLD